MTSDDKPIAEVIPLASHAIGDRLRELDRLLSIVNDIWTLKRAEQEGYVGDDASDGDKEGDASRRYENAYLGLAQELTDEYEMSSFLEDFPWENAKEGFEECVWRVLEKYNPEWAAGER